MGKENSTYSLFGFDFGQNEGQRELIRLINIDPAMLPVVFCKGAAGTGKTFAALAASLNLVRGKGSKRKYKAIFYVREPVEIGHRLGYLKGTAEDKYGPYIGPLLDNYNHLMGNIKDAPAHEMREPKKKILDDEIIDSPMYQHLPNDIIPLAPEFMRGRSFADCILLIDEAQNMNLDELQTMVTRIGRNCKMVIIGSPNQIDIEGQTPEENDFELSYETLKPTELVGYVELTEPMRSSFVTDFDLRFVAYKKEHPERKK
jgi:PhoH-like ATPase